MANNENVSSFNRKGKPSGNGRENETLQEAAGEAQETKGLDTSELEMRHANRHLQRRRT
jgi:hypothetical protein